MDLFVVLMILIFVMVLFFIQYSLYRDSRDKICLLELSHHVTEEKLERLAREKVELENRLAHLENQIKTSNNKSHDMQQDFYGAIKRLSAEVVKIKNEK